MQIRILVSLLALFGGALALPARASGDGTEILQFLSSTGADANGTCRARWRQDADSTDFNVELDHMAAGDYELHVGGALHGTVTVGALGEGEIEFKTPQDGNKPLLDFEVMGQLVEVRQDATTFFSDVFDGSGAGGGGGGSGAGGAGAKIEVFMVNVGPDMNAQGRLRHEFKDGKRRFDVEVENLDAGTYQLVVAGAPVAEFAANGVETEIEFQDPVEPGKVLLNFEPLAAQVDIVSGDTTFLTVVMPAAGTGAPSSGNKGAKDTGKKKADSLQVVLLNSGVAPAASGKADLSVSGQTEFEVEFEDAPAADYQLRVGGVAHGAVATGSAGQWRFSTSPEAGETLLDFDVRGQLVEVSNGSETLLSVVFPVSVQAALGSWKKEVKTAAVTKLNFVPTGVDLDVRGLVRFQHLAAKDRLAVSVVDLPAGSYDLIVGGQTVPEALVVAKADGAAQVRLSSQPAGKELLLDFAVAGQVVQVTPAGDSATVLLEVVVE